MPNHLQLVQLHAHSPTRTPLTYLLVATDGLVASPDLDIGPRRAAVTGDVQAVLAAAGSHPPNVLRCCVIPDTDTTH